MHSSPLAEDEVAFFVFPHIERHAFWNRNVSFAIDLAFADEYGRIVDFAVLEPHQELSVRPESASRFVVEAPKGTFGRVGASKGDLVVCDGKTLKVIRASQ